MSGEFDISRADLRVLASPLNSREAVAEFVSFARRIDPDSESKYRCWEKRLERQARDEAWLCVARHQNVRLHQGLELEDYVESLREVA